MKKFLILIIVIAACAALYFISSLAFPVWGERVVVPVMILCLAVGAVCAVWLAILLIRQGLRNKKKK